MSLRRLVVVVCCCLVVTSAAWAEEVQPSPAQPGAAEPAPAPAAVKDFPARTIDVQLGGGGVVGALVRSNLSQKFSVGIGAMLRPTAIVNESDDSTETSLGVFFPIECTFWKPGKGGDKGPNRHGLGLMAGVGVGRFTEVGAGVYYDYDRFVRNDHVYTASIGLAYMAPVNLPDNVESATSVGLFWRFGWGWGI